MTSAVSPWPAVTCPGITPKLSVYDTTCEGPASPGDALREADRVEVTDEVQLLDDAAAALTSAGVPRYGDLVRTACAKLGWALEDLRVHRIAVDHPLVGMQICLQYEAAD